MMMLAWMCTVVLTNWPAPAQLAAPTSARDPVWLAQEAPPPPVPPRRFLGRQGLRDVVRPPNVPQRPEEAQQGGQGGPPAVPGVGVPGGAPGVPVQPPVAPPGAPRPLPPPQPAVPVAPAAPAAAAAANEKDDELDFAARAKKGKFSFEFAKAELIDLVKAISNLTRRNFIIPEDLKGKRITILSPTKISGEEAYQVFLHALEVNGISIVRAGKFYKLVPAKDARQAPIPTCIGDSNDCPRYSDQMVTLILPLLHVDAQQVNPVVKMLLSKDGDVAVFQPSNLLIISEYAPNLTRVRKIIEALDVPGFEDELQIVKIRWAAASEVADKLSQVFEVAGRGGGGRPGGQAPGVPPPPVRKQPGEGGEVPDEGEVHISKIVPDDRTNQIIIKANKRSFDAIRALIDRLDIPMDDQDAGKVHVYYLENASAEDLSSTLSSLAQGQPRAGQRPAGAPPQGGQGGESAQLFEGEVKITADKATNSLVVIASGHDFQNLRRIIEKLDTPRRQVYVEAAILEVTVKNDDQFGVNWHTPMRFSENDLGKTLGGTGTVGFVQSAQSSGGLSPTIGALSNPAALLGVAAGSVVGVIGKGMTIPVGDTEVTIPSFGIILKALQSSSNAQILSTPHILTTDNEEASIEVGQKIPFLRGTSLPSVANLGAAAGAAGAGGAANALAGLGGLGGLFSSIDRQDVSLKLTLTPQINERDKIRLEIDQQIEDISGREESTQQPITSTRKAKTTVVVDDQQTIIIGGLMRDRRTDSESKIPILGDLPIIGFLFRQRTTETEKVNLLLVLTPYIIRDANDFQRIFELKMEEHEEFAAEYYGHRAEYRAHVDYSKKSGPLAKLVAAVHREENKVENGGKGDGEEILITPRSDSRNQDSKPHESKALEMKPLESKPSEAKPAEAKPEDKPAPPDEIIPIPPEKRTAQEPAPVPAPVPPPPEPAPSED